MAQRGDRVKPENARISQIEVRNSEAWARIAEYRREAAGPGVSRKELALRQRDVPYFGLVPCRAAGLDFVMFHANDDVVARDYLWIGEDGYEPEMVRAWAQWCQGGGVVLDIGGYSGLMSVIAARSNPKNEVHLFEPLERTIERANINVKLNGLARRIRLHAVAVSEGEGEVVVNLYRDENFLGTGNSIDPKEGLEVQARKTIRTIAIDRYLPGISPIAVKIDVEGHELACLRGMTETLRRTRPSMLIEVWERTRAEVLELLEQLGYAATRLGHAPRRVENYIALPRDGGG